MSALKRALRVLRARPYTPETSEVPGMNIQFVVEPANGWDGYSISALDSGAVVGSMVVEKSLDGWYEMEAIHLDPNYHGLGIGQTLVMLAVEAVPTGLIPNITNAMSDQALRMFESLDQYGHAMGIDQPEEWVDGDSAQFETWDEVQAAGMDKVVIEPEPPPGWANWQEMVEQTGGRWDV